MNSKKLYPTFKPLLVPEILLKTIDLTGNVKILKSGGSNVSKGVLAIL